MSALDRLAREAGLLPRWEDAAGTAQAVSAETLEVVLAALGLPASNPDEISASHRRLADMRAEGARRFITATIGETIALPVGIERPAALVLENGERREVDPAARTIAGIAEPGYHRLLHGSGETIIAVAPERCLALRDIVPSGRAWGIAVQLPSLREHRTQESAFGDLGTLAHAAEALGRSGADLLAISPIHALFPADARRFSPYAPSSRRFLNVLLADPALAGGESEAEALAREDDLIDWEVAIPDRLARLRHLFDRASPDERRRIAAPDHVSDDELAVHALHDALHAHFASEGMHGWREWPAEYRRPDSAAAKAFAAEHPAEIAFYGWLQSLANHSLLTAQRAAQGAGMACGIITDLAVGVDPGGADCWTRPEAFLEGLSVGAPPDLLGPDGQDWGLTTFNPLTLHADGFRAFRETLAAAMDNAGGVRIDHMLGLGRIWVVPHGYPSSHGCYLTMPQRDLMNVLALESWRHRCIVIGEDLGTVPPGFRETMKARHVHGMRVLWFERGENGAFTDPASWTREAAAMTSTHDVPTLAGWWQGRDLDWAQALGRITNATGSRHQRETDKAVLWRVLCDTGLAEGPPPVDAAPFVSAAIAHVAASACDLALVPLEDLAGLAEQPNLPGTIDEHPNWRRRMPDSVKAMLAWPDVAARVAALKESRDA
ncbi:4-alpha-glucanotransferase [Erythrobacter sp.]|uniref:4-alpha-glucanotransferase n=1 Tax=Erythrobacter sp. TaxID=1042 RepID=UPI0025DA7496|nr:4-alpha-glucanotransferase [Erythrobacter sp.]